MKEQTKWITYDCIDFYDVRRFEWKAIELEQEYEALKRQQWKNFEDWCNLYGFPVTEKEKQVENGM